MKITQKQTIILSVVVFVAVIFFGLRSLGPQDSWECDNGSWVAHGKPSASKPAGSCVAAKTPVSDVACNTAVDCVCGAHKVKGICAWGNSGFISDAPSCADFCKAGSAQCVGGKCVVE